MGDVVYRDTPGQEMKKGTFRRRGQKKGLREWYEGRSGIGKGIWRVEWEQGMDSCNIKSNIYTTIAALYAKICPQNLTNFYPSAPNSTAIIA